MQITADISPKPFKILYVDDEVLALKYFRQIVEEEFLVITAQSAEEGLKILEEDDGAIAVVISDQRMNGMQGITFLSELRKSKPTIARILATAFSDVSTAVAAINEGAIYHYINKPWSPELLIQTMRRAMEWFQIRAERETLLKEKSAMVRQLIVTDRLAGFGVLAQGINHHLRNALVPVEAYLQLTEHPQPVDGVDDGDAAFLREMQKAARTQVRHITSLLGRLSTVSKTKQISNDDSVDTEELLVEVITQLSESLEDKQMDVTVSVEGEVPLIQCNRSRLSHVMRLILQDELELLEPSNAINIVLRHFERDVNDEHVCIELSDSGPNLAAERLTSVFTPFFVREENPQYAGLSLASSYVTLCSIGGWAQAYDDPERGTVLAFSIPVKPVGRRSGAVKVQSWDEGTRLKTDRQVQAVA